MRITKHLSFTALLAVCSAQSALAEDKQAQHFVVVNPDAGVPVFPNEITDRPYKIIGEVKAGVRKATVFSGEASQAKIYRELWERAEKLGADAVIKAQYGNSHVSAMSWGQTNATGTAIKFTEAGTAQASPPPSSGMPN